MKNAIQNAIQNSQKVAMKFYCEKCDYGSNKRGDYNKHLQSKKHNAIYSDKNAMKNSHKCVCGRSYKHQPSFVRHKKKCIHVIQDTSSPDTSSLDPSSTSSQLSPSATKLQPSTTEMMDFMRIMMKEMNEMNKDLISEIIPKISNTTHNNTHNGPTTNNTNNNHFNINVFLNEQCKDAMNLTDFIDSIQLSIEDVTNIGEKGQTVGFAKILVDKLSTLDLYERPVHCSDAKRETLYVKNNDIWDKEPHDRPQIKKAIDDISMKGIQRVPDLDLPNDKMTTTISEIVNTPVNHKKIISTVAKEIKI